MLLFPGWKTVAEPPDVCGEFAPASRKVVFDTLRWEEFRHITMAQKYFFTPLVRNISLPVGETAPEPFPCHFAQVDDLLPRDAHPPGNRHIIQGKFVPEVR